MGFGRGYRHRDTWWWNDDVSDNVSKKHKL